MDARPKYLLIKIVFAILGAISGVSIFCSFSYYKNWHAATWGLLSGIFAIVVLRLHLSRRKNTLHLRYNAETLRMAKLCGIYTSLASLVAALTYFILAAVINHGYQIENNGYAPAGIFSLMTLKWTAMLFFAGKNYEAYLRSYEEIETSPKASNQPYQAFSNGSKPRNLESQ